MFFLKIKNLNTNLSTFEIKNLFRFLKNKEFGYFTSSRWDDFYRLFMMKFIKYDLNIDCLLNESELVELINEEMKVLINFIPKGYTTESLVKEIIFSLDHNKKGGINLSDYLLLKKIVIGFNQYHVAGFLEKENFSSAIKTSFADETIDEIDAEMAYKISLNLMYEGDNELRLNFIKFFEISRIVNTFLSFGVTIGEGFITKDNILTNYENTQYPSKLGYPLLKSYFNIFDDDNLNSVCPDSSKHDLRSLRFEDFTNLEFYANIFTNYTDTNYLNEEGLKKLFTTNKYVPNKWLNYIGNSNFEDMKKTIIESEVSSNITEFDFLHGYQSYYSFKEKNTEHSNSRMQMKSLFELNLDELNDEKLSPEKITQAIIKYFTILDFNGDNKISFDEYITFIKYLKIFDVFNKDNDDSKGIVKTDKVNMINQIKIHPSLSNSERLRIQSLDTILCNYVDLLFFFDYMIAPKIFSKVASQTGDLVDEVNLQINMNLLNLFTEINNRKFQASSGIFGNKFDYSPILTTGLKNKCKSNQIKFGKNKKNPKDKVDETSKK